MAIGQIFQQNSGTQVAMIPNMMLEVPIRAMSPDTDYRGGGTQGHYDNENLD